MGFRLLLTLFVTTFLYGAHAQSYKFRSYGQSHGIEQRFIYTINQSQDGYILIGTEDGLLKFNGVRFKKVDLKSTSENLGIITVSSHVEEAKIWYGFNDGRVVLLNLRDYSVVFDSVISNGSITGIIGDENRNVWISTVNEGLFKIDSKLTVSSFDLEEYDYDLQINCINLLPPEELVLGTGSGLLSIHLSDLNQASSLPKKNKIDERHYINTMVGPRDAQGLYVGTKEHGVWFYQGRKDGGQYTSMKLWPDDHERNVKSIVEDKSEALWVAVSGEGLYRLNPSNDSTELQHTLYNEGNGLSSNSIRSLYCDIEGNIWIGHFGQGLSSFLENFLELYTVKVGDQLKKVHSLIEVQGELYLGVGDGLLSVSNGNWKNLEYVFPSQLKGKLVTCLVKGEDGNIWIATKNNGIYRWSIDNNSMEEVPFKREGPVAYVNSLLPVKNGLWIATQGGLRYVNYDYSGLVTYTMEDGMASNNVSSLLLHKDELWIASNISVVTRFADGAFEQYFLNTGEAVANIVGISTDKDDNIWAATEGKGIIQVTRDETKAVTKKEGLASNYCQGILRDKYDNFLVLHRGEISRIWSGLSGIDVLDEVNGIDGEFNQNAIYTDGQGNIWLGTTKGVIKYIPDNNALENQGPAVHLVSVQVGDQLIDFSKPVDMAYGPHRLEIHYEGMSFKNGQNIRYQYMLEGYDDDWSGWTKSDHVVYRKVQDGKYRFRVRACISEDACTTTRSLVNIDINPPYWKAWWFYLLVSGVAGLIVFAFVKVRERNFKKTEKYLQSELNDRIKDVIRHEHELELKNEQLEVTVNQKETLLKEVHHRVKNNLQLVSSLLSLQERKVEDERVSEILKNSQSRIGTMALLHKKLYTSEDIGSVPYQDYVENLAAAISDSYGTDACDVTLEINLEDVSFGIDTSVPLGLILNELITNCYKYAFTDRKEGVIKIDLVHLDGTRHRLMVGDNGVGMPEGFVIDNSTSLGLELVHVLSEQLDGSVKCTWTEKGTNFTITFNI